MKLFAKLSIAFVVALVKPFFDRSFFDVDDYMLKFAAHHGPELDGAFRINNGDIQDRIKHIAHGRQRQCHSPCPWRQQMLVRGATTFPFLIRETRAFNEIYDGSRRIAKFLTSVARGLEVSTLLFRMLDEVGLRIAFHERHVHSPPGRAEERKPHQFLLDKELEERNSPVQRRLHGDYVNPGLVIGNYEVPLVLA